MEITGIGEFVREYCMQKVCGSGGRQRVNNCLLLVALLCYFFRTFSTVVLACKFLDSFNRIAAATLFAAASRHTRAYAGSSTISQSSLDRHQCIDRSNAYCLGYLKQHGLSQNGYGRKIDDRTFWIVIKWTQNIVDLKLHALF